MDAPKPTKGDIAHEITSTAINSIPIVGPVGGVLFRAVLQAPLQRRTEEWAQRVETRIARLEETVAGLSAETLGQNERFVSAVLRASRIALQTHDELKRQALLAAIENSATGTLEEVKEALFFGLLDSFSPLHLQYLDRIHRNTIAFEAGDYDRCSDDLDTTLVQELAGGSPGLHQLVWEELGATRGLIAHKGAPEESNRVSFVVLSEIGMEFFSFITSDLCSGEGA